MGDKIEIHAFIMNNITDNSLSGYLILSIQSRRPLLFIVTAHILFPDFALF